MAVDYQVVAVPNAGQTQNVWVQGGSTQSVYVAAGQSTPGQDNTFTYSQAAHGFAVLNVVAWTPAGWVKADKDGPIDTFLVIGVPDANSFTVSIGGRVNVAHNFGSNPANLYLGDNGQLTLTPPQQGLTPRQQIVIAIVLGAGALWVKPEARAW